MIMAYGGNIIAKRIGENNKNSSGVIKTSSNKEKPLKVEVIDSKVVDIEKGNAYLIARYSGMEIEHEGEEFVIISKDDIIAEVFND